MGRKIQIPVLKEKKRKELHALTKSLLKLRKPLRLEYYGWAYRFLDREDRIDKKEILKDLNEGTIFFAASLVHTRLSEDLILLAIYNKEVVRFLILEKEIYVPRGIKIERVYYKDCKFEDEELLEILQSKEGTEVCLKSYPYPTYTVKKIKIKEQSFVNSAVNFLLASLL